METTQNMTTVRAQDVPPVEIMEMRDDFQLLVNEHVIAEDSPLVAAIFLLLDTLEAGVDVTVITEPALDEYVLA